ncbi:hypothetical protein [Micromonospora chokoriensis]
MYDPNGDPLTNPPTTFEERMEAGDAWIRLAISLTKAGKMTLATPTAGIAAAFFASAAAIKPSAASNN